MTLLSLGIISSYNVRNREETKYEELAIRDAQGHHKEICKNKLKRSKKIP